mmetsp:Transcript_17243/g.55360  ORF Transcript_17243/g.55360 Transcript_17243/m.55360 type:complete len:394 (+) Transcript_17243:3-1184(+)
MSEETAADVVVIDNGTGSIKAGFSGEDAPRAVFPTVVGSARTKAMQRTEVHESFVGSLAQQKRDVLALSYPIKRGRVVDWDAMEKIWEWTIHSELGIDSESTALPVLMTEMPLLSRDDRQRAAEIIFSKLHIPAYFAMNQATLSLFSSGRTRGLVIECGEGVSHTVPVFEGFALQHASLRLGIAGQDITQRLQQLLVARRVVPRDTQLETSRQIKETLGSVAPSARDGPDGESAEAFELPDGHIVQVPLAACSDAFEMLFEPETLGEDRIAALKREAQALGPTLFAHSASSGLCQAAVDSVTMCDADLQTDLYGTVVLAGGTTVANGFAERVARELSSLAPAGTRVNVYPDSQRKYAAWIGGSMLGSLPTFAQMRIMRNEYEEDANVVHRRAL